MEIWEHRLKWSYSDLYDNATEIDIETPVFIETFFNGAMKYSSGLDFLYLFVYSALWANQGKTSITFIDLPSYITVTELGFSLISEAGMVTHGYQKFKLQVGENTETSIREDTFRVDFQYIDRQTLITKSFYVKIKLDGREHQDEPTVDNNVYYRVDTLLNNYNAPLTLYNVITAFPKTLNDSYSKNGYNQSNINAFRYIYIRTIDEQAPLLTPYSEVSWAKLVSVHTQLSPNLNVFEIQVDPNNTSFIRNAILSIKNGGTTILNISLVLYTVDNPEIPDIPTDADTAEDKYWERGSTGNFVITDTNEGAIIDSTLLLFKSNYANIYNTIELKDGTLFLGNYINENSINNVHDVMNLYIDTEKIITSEGTRKMPVNLSGASDYTYIPNMTLSSQLKRLFKYGETYALGIVFIYKTGKQSSVYYLGDTKGKWSPETEPFLVEENDSIIYRKPVRYCALSQDVTNALYSNGVVAAVPVYAVKNTHSVMCQGFLSPTLYTTLRQLGESIEAQYSWFYRDLFPTLETELPSGLSSSRYLKEILNLDANTSIPWGYNRQICSLNTPEVEVDEVLSDAMLVGASCRAVKNYTGFTYTNNLTLSVSGKYLYSYYNGSGADNIPMASITNRRIITGYFWHGFFNDGYKSTDNTLLDNTNKPENYKWFAVYPWLRGIIGGEGPSSLLVNKRLFNSLYSSGLTANNHIPLNLRNIEDIAIYRDFDTASIIRVGSSIYQGNTDYIVITETANAYKAWTNEGRAPYANADDGNYAGYDKDGKIVDPISIKYKTAPHIAIKFDSPVTYDQTERALFCIELLDAGSSDKYKTDVLDLQGYLWIKCGDLKRILPTEQTTLIYEEGDYFFGRFDSLRTYCYTEEDTNSIVEVVSGMLCSRVNLDSRCDRNRGAKTPTISPENFNVFNPVYNQLNNYFTFSYINQGDIVYKRKYSNSILWSLTKEYSSDVDNWCNIQDINTLDFDGDKGEIQSITKSGNNLIVFQDTGISQIQYNEKTLIATSEGVPIEIANSNKVEGKYYLYDSIGCQYKGSISKSPNGIYFVDSINKTLYLLKADGSIVDLCLQGGMKSWGLANINSNWWSYYDVNSQEVLFVNDLEALSYSDSYQRFNAFIGYGGVRWNFRANDKTIQICPVNFNQVISTTTPTLSSNKRQASTIVYHNNSSTSFWKKNSTEETKFFGYYSPIEIQLQCNPEPTVDKMFSVVEYRMDCFDEGGNYMLDITFDAFRAWNEYQDTLETNLKYNEGNEKGPVYNTVYSTKVRKKFRIWRIDIPRAYYGSTAYIQGNEAIVPDINYYTHLTPAIEAAGGTLSRDRIRNPWCNIYLSLDTSRTKKVIFNDLSIQYFK